MNIPVSINEVENLPLDCLYPEADSFAVSGVPLTRPPWAHCPGAVLVLCHRGKGTPQSERLEPAHPDTGTPRSPCKF